MIVRLDSYMAWIIEAECGFYEMPDFHAAFRLAFLLLVSEDGMIDGEVGVDVNEEDWLRVREEVSVETVVGKDKAGQRLHHRIYTAITEAEGLVKVETAEEQIERMNDEHRDKLVQWSIEVVQDGGGSGESADASNVTGDATGETV